MKPLAETATAIIAFRVRPELKHRIELLAAKKYSSPPEYLRRLLVTAIEADGNFGAIELAHDKPEVPA
jgi:hypothetical protein